MVTEKDFIRPCPFCGGYAEFEEHRVCIGHGEYITSSFIRCQRCGSTGHSIADREVTDRGGRKQKAIEEWNFRYNDQIDRLRKTMLMSFYGTLGDKARKEITEDIKRFNNITEVVHGRWIIDRENLTATCSECGHILRFSDEMQIILMRDEERFCYYCGAKMDGDGNG